MRKREKEMSEREKLIGAHILRRERENQMERKERKEAEREEGQAEGSKLWLGELSKMIESYETQCRSNQGRRWRRIA